MPITADKAGLMPCGYATAISLWVTPMNRGILVHGKHSENFGYPNYSLNYSLNQIEPGRLPF